MKDAVLVRFKGNILDSLKVTWEELIELEYLLEEMDPLNISNFQTLEALHDIINFIRDLLDQLCRGFDLYVLREPALLDPIDDPQLLQGDLEVLNAAILEDVERRKAKLNFFEAELDLLFHPINWLL